VPVVIVELLAKARQRLVQREIRQAHWAERSQGMRLVERRAVPPFGHFSLIRFAKAGATTAARLDEQAARAAA